MTGVIAHGQACTRERYGDDCDKDVFCMGEPRPARGLEHAVNCARD